MSLAGWRRRARRGPTLSASLTCSSSGHRQLVRAVGWRGERVGIRSLGSSRCVRRGRVDRGGWRSCRSRIGGARSAWPDVRRRPSGVVAAGNAHRSGRGRSRTGRRARPKPRSGQPHNARQHRHHRRLHHSRTPAHTQPDPDPHAHPHPLPSPTQTPTPTPTPTPTHQPTPTPTPARQPAT